MKGKWIISKGELAEAPQPQPRAGLTMKIGLFQTGFLFRKKYFLEIPNRYQAYWMLHLDDSERQMDSF